MESVKRFLSSIPPVAWVIIVLVSLIFFWWISDDIGSWWENRKQTQFDKIQAEKQVEIDKLKQEKEAALQRAAQAEARELVKAQQVEVLEASLSKYDKKVSDAQDKIEDAGKKYTEDLNLIEKVKTGEVTKLQLCEMQCKESAELGYNCRPNYCDKYK